MLKKLLVIGVGLCTLVCATDGMLDTSFGNGSGFVATPAGFLANAVAIQTDGKYVVTGQDNNGDIQTVRYNSDGTVDTNFGSNGIVTSDFGIAYALYLQPDGKIVIGGQLMGGQSFIYRYLNTGVLDSGFGTSGSILGDIATVYAIDMQRDGKLIVAGSNNTNGSEIIRYTSKGAVDVRFTSIANRPIRSIAIQQDGSLFAGGTDSTFAFFLLHFHTNGALNKSFGINGIAEGPAGTLTGIALQPGGKILASGYTGVLTNNFQIVRFNGNGSLDQTFGTAGITVGPEGTGNALLVQPNGKPLIVGQAKQNLFQVARYTATGILDSTFNSTGFNDQIPAIAYGGALQADGSVVLSGLNANFSDFQIARYTGSNIVTAPQITHPTAGSTMQAGPLTFAGLGQRGAAMFLFIDGVNMGSAIASTSKLNWSIPVSALTPGAHIAQIVSVYRQGNVLMASPSISFTVATSAAVTAMPFSKNDLLQVRMTNSTHGRAVKHGDMVTFTAAIANLGSDDATDVVISSVLPSELLYLSSYVSTGDHMTFHDGVASASIGTLRAGEAMKVSITAAVFATAPAPLNTMLTVTNSNSSSVKVTNVVMATK